MASSSGELSRTIALGIPSFQFLSDLFNSKKEESIKEIGGLEAALNFEKSFLGDFFALYKGSTLFLTIGVPEDALGGRVMKILRDETKKRANTYLFYDFPDLYNNSNMYFPDKHFTKKGYQVLVNNLLNYLKVSKLIPCD